MQALSETAAEKVYDAGPGRAGLWVFSDRGVLPAMTGKITYLNTDLDLVSERSLRVLARNFDKHGVFPLHVTHDKDGRWYARFETNEEYGEPETNIAAMLDVIESLAARLRGAWLACSLREFNFGYDCGSRPWAYNQGLSCQLLERIARAGASLRVTMYPPYREKRPPDKSKKPRK